MTVDQFTARRRPVWLELETAITRASGGLRTMPATDLERFGVLYRHAASDLAIAARDFPDDQVTTYLNGLCSRAHPLLYRGRAASAVDVVGFYTRDLPRLWRASSRYVLSSLLLLLVGFIAGWLAVRLRPDLAPSLVPSSLFDEMARGKVGAQVDDRGAIAVGIFVNNIKVALICFVGGIVIGLPTVLILVSNGWVLGTLAAAIHEGGYDYAFWSLILPHGVMELSVIVFAGASGLMVGDAILRPGLLRRGDALSEAGVRSLKFALGVASLLPICGLIEAFISPSVLPAPAKLMVAAATGIALYSWLLLAGRERQAPPPLLTLGESASRVGP